MIDGDEVKGRRQGRKKAYLRIKEGVDIVRRVKIVFYL